MKTDIRHARDVRVGDRVIQGRWTREVASIRVEGDAIAFTYANNIAPTTVAYGPDDHLQVVRDTDRRGVLLEAVTGASTMVRSSPLPPVGAALIFDREYGEIVLVYGHHEGQALVSRGCENTDARPYQAGVSFLIS